MNLQRGVSTDTADIARKGRHFRVIERPPDGERALALKSSSRSERRLNQIHVVIIVERAPKCEVPLFNHRPHQRLDHQEQLRSSAGNLLLVVALGQRRGLQVVNVLIIIARERG